MMEQKVVCKNCGNSFIGKYCNRCGEQVYTNHDKSIFHFFEEALHFLTHFEGKFLTTVKAIFFKPGRLSFDYCNGIRKKYFKPLPLFMLLVVLYLIFPLFSGLNMPFRFYLQPGSFAARATQKETGVDIERLQQHIQSSVNVRHFDTRGEAFVYEKMLFDSALATHPTLQKLESTFRSKSEKTSKILLVLLIPFTAIVLWLLAIRKHRYFFDHLVLSTEINSFYILFSFFVMPLVISIMYKLFPANAPNLFTELSLAITCYLVVAIFATLAFRLFYRDKWWWAVSKALLIIVSHYYIVQVIYKFILFAFTFFLST